MMVDFGAKGWAILFLAHLLNRGGVLTLVNSHPPDVG